MTAVVIPFPVRTQPAPNPGRFRVRQCGTYWEAYDSTRPTWVYIRGLTLEEAMGVARTCNEWVTTRGGA